MKLKPLLIAVAIGSIAGVLAGCEQTPPNVTVETPASKTTIVNPPANSTHIDAHTTPAPPSKTTTTTTQSSSSNNGDPDNPTSTQTSTTTQTSGG